MFDSSMFMVEDGRSFDTTVTVSFEDRGGKTHLRIVQTGFDRQKDRDGIQGGWPSVLDALERVVVARRKEAPR